MELVSTNFGRGRCYCVCDCAWQRHRQYWRQIFTNVVQAQWHVSWILILNFFNAQLFACHGTTVPKLFSREGVVLYISRWMNRSFAKEGLNLWQWADVLILKWFIGTEAFCARVCCWSDQETLKNAVLATMEVLLLLLVQWGPWQWSPLLSQNININYSYIKVMYPMTCTFLYNYLPF